MTCMPKTSTSPDILIKMLDGLPTGDADVDVPAISIDDAEAVGRMSRPAHILGEFDARFPPPLPLHHQSATSVLLVPGLLSSRMCCSCLLMNVPHPAARPCTTGPFSALSN